MNNIATEFSIKDLENLSGIKAHTIRIWEKRYAILHPTRSDTNIRNYDLKNLQKLLNVTLLYNNGYKISKIALMGTEELMLLVAAVSNQNKNTHHYLDLFKVAMMSFDTQLFDHTYNKAISVMSFKLVFVQLFVPFLSQIGIEWQSDRITPAHEHFIAHLIKQKISIETEKVQSNEPQHNDKTFVLFLPLNEIHELGLLYVHYELLNKGYRSIYLGQSVPVENLVCIPKVYQNIHYISCFTVKPTKEDVVEYLTTINDTVLCQNNSSLVVFGRNIQGVKPVNGLQRVSLFDSVESLMEIL